MEDDHVLIPTSFEAWKSIPWLDEGYGWQWEALRPFFAEKGYTLYVPTSLGLRPVLENDPASDSFGLHGCRTDFRQDTVLYCPRAELWGARDRNNRDVVIKPVSCGDVPSNELAVLKYLNSDELRADEANATVPVLEFIEYGVWTFAVTPRWTDSTSPEFTNIGEVCDWALQFIKSIAFIHRHHIAHLDISHENLLMNFWGIVPARRARGKMPPELRSSFPARYALIDFGCSVQFPPGLNSESHRGSWRVPREQSAPETHLGNFDPFAADVYQTGRTLYGWCLNFIDVTPDILAVLQDMTRTDPALRLSAEEAHARMLVAIDAVSNATQAIELPGGQLQEFDPVPSRIDAYVYGHSPY